jgi:predicted DNA-binding transcriptional regulator YafY
MAEATETAGAVGGLRWGVTRRLEFIDFRLLWEGRVNRSDIAERFGISVQQASGDMRLYEEAAPDNIAYDRNAKTYVRAPSFRPKFIDEYSDRQLLQLMALKSNWIREEDTYFNQTPPLAVADIARRRPTSRQLMWVLDAIRGRREIRIDYHSISGPNQTIRHIAPHAIAWATGRWHARAWSREHGDFRDFNLNRFSEAEPVGPAPADPELDLEWTRSVDLVVAPNPRLDAETRAAVAMEFEMEGEQLRLPTRLAMVFYLKAQHNFDVAPGDLPPAKQQLVLLNADEVELARVEAREGSKRALRELGLNGAS